MVLTQLLHGNRNSCYTIHPYQATYFCTSGASPLGPPYQACLIAALKRATMNCSVHPSRHKPCNDATKPTYDNPARRDHHDNPRARVLQSSSSSDLSNLDSLNTSPGHFISIFAGYSGHPLTASLAAKHSCNTAPLHSLQMALSSRPYQPIYRTYTFYFPSSISPAPSRAAEDDSVDTILAADRGSRVSVSSSLR